MSLDNPYHSPDRTVRTKDLLIQDRREKIKKFKHLIEEIQNDATLSESDRQKKIARYNGFIADYEFDIKMAQQFIDFQNKKNDRSYQKYMNQK